MIGEGMKLKCIECGSWFIAKGKFKICSARCRLSRQKEQIRNHQQKNYKPVQETEKICPVCHKLFFSKGKRLSCSDKCAREKKTARDTQKANDRYWSDEKYRDKVRKYNVNSRRKLISKVDILEREVLELKKVIVDLSEA